MFGGILCSGVLLMAGCRSNTTITTTGDAVQMPRSVEDEPFSDSVLSLELVPLETDGHHLLGNNVELGLQNDGYIVYDKRNARIFCYSQEGEFLHVIGGRGNGPGEYLNIRNLQVIDGKIHVFSQPDKELVFSSEGELLEHRSGVPVGFGIHRVDAGILSYYGYSGQRNHRIVLKRGETGLESGFLKLDAKLMTLDLENELFYDLPGGGVSILDSYSPTVYQYDQKTVSAYLNFDFGKYAIREAFYQARDAFESAELLMLSNYAVIGRYMESEYYKLVQVNVFDQQDGSGEGRYGIYDGEKWRWFSLKGYGLEDMTPFRCITGNVLIGVLSPEDAGAICNALQGKVINPERIQGIKADDNYVIAKMVLQ